MYSCILSSLLLTHVTSLEMQHESNNISSISILDECEAIKLELDSLERNFQQASKHPESILNNTIPTLRLLEARKDEIKSSTAFNCSNHASQIGKIERKLKETEREYRTVESALRKRSEADATRQYKIANPNATDSEILNAIRDPGVPIFSRNVCASYPNNAANFVISYLSLGATRQPYQPITMLINAI
jgi:t-SNARE complex subunit (syntaxin)